MLQRESHIQTMTKATRRGFGDWAILALLSLALIFAQSMAMTAGTMNEDGIWVEICGGENGSYMVELDGDGQSPNPTDCVHCDGCLLLSNSLTATLTSDWDFQVLTTFSVARFSPALTAGLAGAEQYWSACRGPPLQQSGNRMPTLRIPASFATATAPLNTWSAPCI